MTVTHHITLHIPLDTQATTSREETVDAYNSFRKAMFGGAEPDAMLAALHHLTQCYVGELVVRVKPFCLNDAEAAAKVVELLDAANVAHRKRIERVRYEREVSP